MLQPVYMRDAVQRLIVGLLAISAGFAAYGSLFEKAYSKEFPKRVLLQHLHTLVSTNPKP